MYVFKVIVWSGCDPDQLADALAPIIYGKGADRHFVGALKSADAAKRWITCRYEIESSTNWVDQDVVVMARPENGEDGIEIMLPGDWSRREETAAIHRLVQKFGPEVLGKLPPMAMLYFDAIQDIDQAIKWVLFRYQVVGIRKGNQFHAQFARRYNPYGLSRLDSAYRGDQNGHSDTGLDYVLRKYRGQIIPRLYLEADSRETIVDEYRIYPQDMASRSYGDCETIKQTENGFVVNFYDDKDAPRDYYGKDEAVLLSEKNLERFKNNCCLLAEPVTVGPFKSVASDLKFGEAGNPWEIISSQSEGSPAIRAILCDGNPFFFSNKEHQILIPIRAGETKRLIFSMSHEWTYRHNYSVWGVSVTLTEDGVEITPVDPEVSYSWDDEGNIKRN